MRVLRENGWNEGVSTRCCSAAGREGGSGASLFPATSSVRGCRRKGAVTLRPKPGSRASRPARARKKRSIASPTAPSLQRDPRRRVGAGAFQRGRSASDRSLLCDEEWGVAASETPFVRPPVGALGAARTPARKLTTVSRSTPADESFSDILNAFGGSAKNFCAFEMRTGCVWGARARRVLFPTREAERGVLDECKCCQKSACGERERVRGPRSAPI